MKTIKSNMSVPVEFLDGTDITQAIREAKEKAQLWNVAYVSFNLNGASFSIGQNADIESVVAEWHETRGKPHGICAA